MQFYKSDLNLRRTSNSFSIESYFYFLIRNLNHTGLHNLLCLCQLNKMYYSFIIKDIFLLITTLK